MSLSAEEIAAVVAELQPLRGGTIQKINAPEPRTVYLELRIPGATHLLLFSAEPDQSRLQVAASRPASPPSPLPIQNLLRAHVLPSRIAGLEALPGDRVVRLLLDTPRGRRVLVAELTGRHGNLFLLDEEGRVLGAATPAYGGTRGLHPGRPYVPPPAPPPGSRKERPPRFVPEGPGPFPLSAAIDRAYGPEVRAHDLARRRREAVKPIAAALNRAERTLEKLAGDDARAADAERFRVYGDLLKPHLAKIPRGARAATVTDWSTGEARELSVPLLPELSPKENLERYYKQYRRLAAARERIAARFDEVAATAERLRALKERAAAAESETELGELAREAAALGARAHERHGGPREERRPPYREYRSATGAPIWVGRGARRNDELTFGTAKGNDLWLHARDVPGAHVIVPLAKGAAPDEETLLDACALAVHHSGARGEAVAEVTVVPARLVRKPKGSAPGAVVYTGEKVRPFRHDEARIARLLAQEPG
jgi:predicted ribosome quality control (RQC) complex YloA/Tae2 family protein